MLDHLSAPASVFLHALAGFTGATVYAVIVAQPWWLPVLCSVLAASPSAWRVIQDHRLKEAKRTNLELLAELKRQKERAEKAEGLLP